MLAWHFVDKTLRDGSPVPADGEWLVHTGPVSMCKSGLHYSLDPFDALKYAPGPVLCRVDIDDVVATDPEKGVCRRRKIVKRGDMTEALRYFARLQALSVIHLWDAPDIVLDYLMTGDNAYAAANAAAYAANAANAAAYAANAVAYAAAYAAANAAANAANAANYAAYASATFAANAVANAAANANAANAAAYAVNARDDFNDLVNECFA
jgi:hypothetical protein